MMQTKFKNLFFGKVFIFLISCIVLLILICCTIFLASTRISSVISIPFPNTVQQNMETDIVYINENANILDDLSMVVNKASVDDNSLLLSVNISNERFSKVSLCSNCFELSISDLKNASNNYIYSSEHFDRIDIESGSNKALDLKYNINEFSKNSLYTLAVYDNNMNILAQVIFKSSDIVQ